MRAPGPRGPAIGTGPALLRCHLPALPGVYGQAGRARWRRTDLCRAFRRARPGGFLNRPLPPRVGAHGSELRAGNPDVQGLCLALADWSAELRILESLRRTPPRNGTA